MNNTSSSDHATGSFIAFAIIGLCFLLGILLTSCESPSSRRAQYSLQTTRTAQPEKVVIIEGVSRVVQIRDIPVCTYKVKRIQSSTVAFIRITGADMFNKGDTILHTFSYNQ